MCEILMLRSRHGPFRLGTALALTEKLESWGDAGYGWGVSWREPGSHGLRLYRNPVSLLRDNGAYRNLGDRWAMQCLIHLRMPSDFQTIGRPDTQPFLSPEGWAFAHNGFFPNATGLRKTYGELLRGNADSEVGMQVFRDALQDTIDDKGNYSPKEAIRQTHKIMGGWRTNLAILFPGGWAYTYSSHVGNAMFHVEWMGMDITTTAMHRRDDKLVKLLFPGANSIREIRDEEMVMWPESPKSRWVWHVAPKKNYAASTTTPIKTVTTIVPTTVTVPAAIEIATVAGGIIETKKEKSDDNVTPAVDEGLNPVAEHSLHEIQSLFNAGKFSEAHAIASATFGHGEEKHNERLALTAGVSPGLVTEDKVVATWGQRPEDSDILWRE